MVPGGAHCDIDSEYFKFSINFGKKYKKTRTAVHKDLRLIGKLKAPLSFSAM